MDDPMTDSLPGGDTIQHPAETILTVNEIDPRFAAAHYQDGRDMVNPQLRIHKAMTPDIQFTEDGDIKTRSFDEIFDEIYREYMHHLKQFAIPASWLTSEPEPELWWTPAAKGVENIVLTFTVAYDPPPKNRPLQIR